MKYVPQLYSLRSALMVFASMLSCLVVRAANVPVTISGFAFQPDSVSVNAGDTVTWTQKDTTAHTSTSDDGLWDSPFLLLNQTFSQTFATAGNFPYHCTPHASFMTGTVIVKAGAVNKPPTVSITSPAPGATLTNPNVTIQANASDPDGSVAKVQFFEGRTSLGEATSAPFQITVTLALGAHNLSAQATDNQGATAASTVVSITISAPANNPPTVSLSSPTDAATFTAPASVLFQAQAADTDGTIAKVEFFQGTDLVGAATSSPYTFTWANVAAGNYTLTAKATDNSGAATLSSPVHIQVKNVTVEAPQIASPSMTADGKFQFTVKGASGLTYSIQSSADAHSWTETQTTPSTGDTTTITVTPPPGVDHQFYQVQVKQ